jgi:hypothetical protein
MAASFCVRFVCVVCVLCCCFVLNGFCNTYDCSNCPKNEEEFQAVLTVLTMKMFKKHLKLF